MKLNWWIYAGLGVVLVASFAAGWLLEDRGLWADILRIPGLLAMVGALYQLWRDAAAHERRQQLQHDQQRFALGATSHMANVVFDKHAAFCEEYAGELHQTLTTLFREAETVKALDHAKRLFDVRAKYTVWITPKMASQLEPFEQALRKIGAMKLTQGRGGGLPPERTEEMFSIFADVVGIARGSGEKANEEIQVTTILQKLRDVLAVPDLIELRRTLMAQHRLDSNAALPPQSQKDESVERFRLPPSEPA